MGVKSSIDSMKKISVNNSSIPLSQLILRDNGYDYMFISEPEFKKMERKKQSNLRELRNQTK